MARRSRDWNRGLAQDLRNPEFAREFLLAAIDEGVPVQHALGKVIRAMGVKEFAAKIRMASPNLLRAINQIRSMREADVIELGAGTGRVSMLLVPLVRSIMLNDASAPMLQVARAKLLGAPERNWSIAVADHRALPQPDRSADVSIAS